MSLTKIIDRTLLWGSTIGFLTLLYDLGYSQYPEVQSILWGFYLFFTIVAFVALSGRIFLRQKGRPLRRLAHIVTWGLALLILLAEISLNAGDTILSAGQNFIFAQLLAVILFFTEVSERLFAIQRQALHPALVFVFSFFALILIGTIMLTLPKATFHGISVVDALFTATSAVCVTGLSILDTGKDFTRFGQIIIMLLIQLGGLGMLTFTNLFGFFFRGQTSFQNQLMLKDFINAENIGNTFRTLVKIVLFTLIVEMTGAFLILLQLDNGLIPSGGEQVFFAIFHSISAFCNAGFSTLTKSLYEDGYKFNYGLHLIVAFLIIIGGIGYVIVFNYFTYAKNWVKAKYARMMNKKQTAYIRPVISLNTKIVVYTTLLLLIFGTVMFYVLEYNNTLKEHSGWGKLITAFFGSVTPRTAGFNTVNVGALTMPTLMIYLLLMWIGASPGSTGGGIKTTTFAVGTFNIIQQITGRQRMEIAWKEIPQKAPQRAFAIISLSLIAVGFSVFFVMVFDGHLGLMPVAFECFSAYGTVGLSMGITSSLSDASKIVITLTMFVGRVSFLTLLMGITQQFFKQRNKSYRFPEEDIFIN